MMIAPLLAPALLAVLLASTAGRAWSWEPPAAPDWLGSAAALNVLQPRCYEYEHEYGGPAGGLSREIEGEVRTGPPVVEAEGTPFRKLDARFPYSNKWCLEHADQHMRFYPAGCRLDDFDPVRFLELFRGRRLVFWGDSVTRQFFTYLGVRLRAHKIQDAYIVKKDSHYHKPPHSTCHLYKNSEGRAVQLTHDCFDLQPSWDGYCYTYHGNATSMCYVRADHEMVDDLNVPFYNDLGRDDIVLANIGIHWNDQPSYAEALQQFGALLHHDVARGREMPLWLWRDTSPQHFHGGEGGNYPVSKSWHEVLRSVNPQHFRCTGYSHEEMVRTNWRNHVLNHQSIGNWHQQYNLTVPILRVWNATSLIPGMHPQVLHGHKNVADCTHFCPNLGGVFEVWSTLFQNFLNAILQSEGALHP